ncbi:hypothetical protein DEI98_14890 [Curtobacterium sp. MCLR17_034]|nr:hypothetical protein DEI98_14890 [Curtobacterium sp. MCLR17_034]
MAEVAALVGDRIADSVDVVPPFVREFNVLYACADDWHGGNPAPGIRRVVGELDRAGAIRRCALRRSPRRRTSTSVGHSGTA